MTALSGAGAVSDRGSLGSSTTARLISSTSRWSGVTWDMIRIASRSDPAPGVSSRSDEEAAIGGAATYSPTVFLPPSHGGGETLGELQSRAIADLVAQPGDVGEQ